MEAIWFYVRRPDGWVPRGFTESKDRWPDGPTHPRCWPTVAAELARAWSAERGIPFGELYRRIEDCAYAFPRGRISRTEDGQPCCFFGEELLIGPQVREEIERTFAVGERLAWRQDEHEHCLAFDRDEVRAALGLVENWEAVG